MTSRQQRKGGKGSKYDAVSQDDEEVDLYAILNVPRHATLEEIKSAYTGLARVFHPDKYRSDDEKLHNEAQEMFILVDRAYKILSGHTERAVYDSFGWEGLHALFALSNEQAKFSKEPDLALQLNPRIVGFVDERGNNLKRKLLGRVFLDREIDAANHFSVRGAVQVNVDGTGLVGQAFEPLNEYDLLYGPDDDTFGSLKFQAPKIIDCAFQQSARAVVSENDSLTLEAQSQIRGKAGVYQIGLGHEHSFSDYTSSEVSFRSSSQLPWIMSIKGNRTLNQSTTGALEFVATRGGDTGVSITTARKLTENIGGMMQLGFGSESRILLQVNRQSRFRDRKCRSKRDQEYEYYKMYHSKNVASEEDKAGGNGGFSVFDKEEHAYNEERAHLDTKFSNGVAMFMAEPAGIGAHLTWARSISRKALIKLGAKMRNGEVNFDISSTRVLSPGSKFNVGLSTGTSGVRVILKYERSGMRYVIPISISSTLSLGAIFLGGLAPALGSLLATQMLASYFIRRRAERRFEIAKKLYSDRQACTSRRKILLKTAAIRREKAASEYGLVILCARYGSRLGEKCDWDPIEAPVLEEYVKVEKGRRRRIPSDWDLDETENEINCQVENENQINETQKNRLAVDHPVNIDVTDHLQFLSDGLTLSLHGGTTKSQLLGFYDPCYGRPELSSPELYVRYQIGSWVFETTCDDLEPLELPSRRGILIGNVLTNPSADFSAR